MKHIIVGAATLPIIIFSSVAWCLLVVDNNLLN
jgi:hypothetical protein